MDQSNRNQAKGSGRRPDGGRVKPVIKARARRLRREMTDAERLLWRHLRRKQLGYGFRRQMPFGRYIVDFVCFDRRLIIEVDGEHHADQVAYDTARTQWPPPLPPRPPAWGNVFVQLVVACGAPWAPLPHAARTSANSPPAPGRRTRSPCPIRPSVTASSRSSDAIEFVGVLDWPSTFNTLPTTN